MNRINNIKLEDLNKVIEVLTAYKEGKIVEFRTDRNGWTRCTTIPCISIMSANRYRVKNK